MEILEEGSYYHIFHRGINSENIFKNEDNRLYFRTGSLFEKNFRRIQIDKETYLKNLVLYVHFNPQIHFGINYRDYKFSSFQPILNGDNSIVNTQEIMDIVEDLENLNSLHEQQDSILEEKFRLE